MGDTRQSGKTGTQDYYAYFKANAHTAARKSFDARRPGRKRPGGFTGFTRPALSRPASLDARKSSTAVMCVGRVRPRETRARRSQRRAASSSRTSSADPGEPGEGPDAEAGPFRPAASGRFAVLRPIYGLWPILRLTFVFRRWIGPAGCIEAVAS